MQAANANLRRLVYSLLIVVAAGQVAGRILSVNFQYEPLLFRDPADPTDTKREWPKVRPRPVPTFSSNDRSRWATIRALVDQQTYKIGQREILDPKTGAYRDSGITFEEGWGGVDRVLNPQPDPDNPHLYYFYSSKPPFLPTLLAGEYWLLKNLLGWSITTHFYSVVRAILLTVNWVPLLLYWVLLARLVEHFGTTDWGKCYVLAAGCFGTFLTTFAITLNNHTIAACTALYALYLALRIWNVPYGQSEHEQGEAPVEPECPGLKGSAGASPSQKAVLSNRLGDFALAGLCAGFTAAVELPALAFLVGLLGLLLWKAPRPTLIGFVPPVLVIVAASLLTNYLAIGRLTPAYAEVGQKSEWYLYQGSHWREEPGKEKTGIDFAWRKESRLQYMFHFLFGHHGVFSLSPMFLLSMAGLYCIGKRFPHADSAMANAAAVKTDEQEPTTAARRPSILASFRPWLLGNPFSMIGALTTYLTVVVVGFYLVKTNNYGGWSSGPRWVFWLTPFWLLTMLPVVDRLAAQRWGRALALLLLGVSVLSASFPGWNPWRHPWIYQWMDAQGWIPY